MARETEIERLVVRFTGDNSGYVKTVNDSLKTTEKYKRGIDGKLRDARGRFVKEQTAMGNALEYTEGKTNEANKALRKFQQRLTRIGNVSRRVSKRVGDVGKSLTLKVTGPSTIFGGLALRSYSQFNQAMTESTSIMAVTEEQTARMRDTALSLSKTAAQAPRELARSYFYLASAGLDAERSMTALPAVTKFATAGAFDMATATDLLTDAQSALGLTSKDATKNLEGMTRLSDVLVKGNTLANASVQQFSEALTNTAAASLRSYNKDVEEGMAVLAAYADQGVKGNVAGTNLSRVMLLLSKSANSNADAHRRLGFSVFDSSGQMRNFADILQNLEQITGNMSDELRSATLTQLGFEARVQQAILPLLGTSEAVRRYEKELRTARGTTEEVANKQMKSFNNQMKLAWNSVTQFAISVGEKLVPAVTAISKDVVKLIEKWEKLSSTQQTLIVYVGLTVAAIGPLLLVLRSVIFLSGAAAGSVAILSKAFISIKATAIAAASGIGIYAAAAMALKAGLIGLAIYGVYRLSKAIYEGTGAMRDFNKEMERGQRISRQIVARDIQRQEELLERASELRGASKEMFLKSALETTKKQIHTIEQQLVGARKRAEELKPTWKSLGQWGKSLWQVQVQQVEEYEQRLESHKNFVARIRDQLSVINATRVTPVSQRFNTQQMQPTNELSNEQEKWFKKQAKMRQQVKEEVETFGMSSDQLQIYNLRKKGASKETIYYVQSLQRQRKAMETTKKLQEQATRMVEENMTKEEKFVKRRQDAIKLFSTGVIDQRTFQREMTAAVKEFEELDKKAKIKLEVEGIDAVAAGTAAARARILQFRETMKGKKTPAIPKATPQEQMLVKNRLMQLHPDAFPSRNKNAIAKGTQEKQSGKKNETEMLLKELVDLAREHWKDGSGGVFNLKPMELI